MSFGDYKDSGFGREMHKVALNNYGHTKSIVRSYGTQPFGFSDIKQGDLTYGQATRSVAHFAERDARQT
jgi:hypothetical protein